MFQLIDNLTMISDVDEVQRIDHEIYLPNLELKLGKSAQNKASLLDLYIKIVNNKFSVSIYDKRDSFPFSTISCCI